MYLLSTFGGVIHMNKSISRVATIREIENEVNVVLDKHKNSYRHWHDDNFKSQNMKPATATDAFSSADKKNSA
jgi:hypothetical protein